LDYDKVIVLVGHLKYIRYVVFQLNGELGHRKYTVMDRSSLAGLGKLDRKRLAKVLRDSKGTVTVSKAAESLGVTSVDAAKMLSRWAKSGWLSRVRRGIYVPVPLEARTDDEPLEDAWIVAMQLFKPCYIGGWSAAEYWDLTEQIFRTVIVMTTRRPRSDRQLVKGTEFWVKTIPDKAMFGKKQIWKGQNKVEISDPTRTLLDMLNDPRLAGGIRSVQDMFQTYLKSEKKNLDLLINYAEQLGNGAVFKRLGFLIEKNSPDDQAAIEACRTNLTSGNAKLDLQLPAERLVTRWRLWVPKAWKEGRALD